MKQHYDDIIPGEDRLLVSLVKSWLHEHDNKLEWNAGNLEFGGSIQGDTIIFSTRGVHLHIQIEMEYPLNESTASALRSQFRWAALRQTPLPGLDVPSNWQIYSQGSNFCREVTFNRYDSTTRTLDITFHSCSSVVYGLMKARTPFCGLSPKGTYFEVHRLIEGHITLSAHLNLISL